MVLDDREELPSCSDETAPTGSASLMRFAGSGFSTVPAPRGCERTRLAHEPEDGQPPATLNVVVLDGRTRGASPYTAAPNRTVVPTLVCT